MPIVPLAIETPQEASGYDKSPGKLEFGCVEGIAHPEFIE
jgi:hypothetical protein